MSVHKHYYLVCTDCGNQFVSPDGDHYGESSRDVRYLAKERGWAYAKVPNGSMWDFCPKCNKAWKESQWENES